MSRGELIVNRVHRDGLGGHSAEEVEELLAPELGERLAARVAHNLADFDVLVQRDRETITRLASELRSATPSSFLTSTKTSRIWRAWLVAEHLFA